MSEYSYRIEFAIQRKGPEDGDYVEIGFGSSGGWGTVEQAMFMAESAVQNGQWETEKGMPSPESVLGKFDE